MNPAMPAQAGAQFISLILFLFAARWYVLPRLARMDRAAALTALLWVHVFRYVALQIFSAQHSGFAISDAGARDIVLGDVGGAIIAFVAILLLRRGSRVAVGLAWLLVAETAYDTVSNIRDGIREHLMGAANGITWMTLVYFVPLVIVSAGLIAHQLYSRRGEALRPATPRPSRGAAGTPSLA